MRVSSAACGAVWLVLAGLATGCGDGKAPTKTYTMAKPPGPLDEIRGLLTRYANGQPVGSEMTTFDALVARVREVDAARADLLDEGLTAIAANPRSAAGLATRLLERIDADPPPAR